MARNIYTGPGSCYARYEGVYIPHGRGVDLASGVTHLYLMLKELERGWTYERGTCQIIPFNYEHFTWRARYLVPLCYAHLGKKNPECEKLKEVVDYTIKHLKLPEWAKHLIKLVIVSPSKSIVERGEPSAVPGRAAHVLAW